MRKLAALCYSLAFAATAAAQPNPADFDLPAAEIEQLYHVELILFAFSEGNHFEEDFRHSIDDPRFLPVPNLLDVPQIEMESVFSDRPGGDFRLPPVTPATEPELPVETATEVEPPFESNAAPLASASDSGAVDNTIAGTDELNDQSELIDRSELIDGLELIELRQRQNSGLGADTESLPAGFRPLTAAELELGDAAARMNRRPYSLLGHAGWVQAGVDTDRSVALDLRWLGITNPTGTIEVYARRFLHAVVDFNFYEGSGSFWTAPAGFAIAPLQYAESYAVKQEVNAIRSGDGTYYIDHPLFGVLIQIRRAPEPEEESGTPTAGGPAG